MGEHYIEIEYSGGKVSRNVVQAVIGICTYRVMFACLICR